MKHAKDLKKGDLMVMDNAEYTVSAIEVSKIAKHGKSKCRVEAHDSKKQLKIFIFASDQEVQTK